MTDFEVPPNPTLARQAPLDLDLPKRGVAVVGCGGVGSWIAYFLALAGVTNLWLFDSDVVSDHNLNRLPLPHEAIGQPKTKTLSEAITKLRPDCHAIAMGAFSPTIADGLNLWDEVDWLACSTDTIASRRMCAAWCRDCQTKEGRIAVWYIEAAAEGEFGSIAGLPGEWETEDEAKPGYASVPVWVGPCVGAAMMAVAHIIHNTPPSDDHQSRLGWDPETYRMSFFDRRSRDTAAEQPNPRRLRWIPGDDVVAGNPLRTATGIMALGTVAEGGGGWRVELDDNGDWVPSENDGLANVVFPTEELAQTAIDEYGSRGRQYRIVPTEQAPNVATVPAIPEDLLTPDPEANVVPEPRTGTDPTPF